MTPDIESLPESPADWLNWTSIQQSIASDPSRFAWVSANAGSGKTHVLTQRVIRLLLSGARPSSILCLTYTKAAASEMSNRILKTLSNWTSLDDDSLARDIRRMHGEEPSRQMLVEARTLFARALETPGGLKIQTIHAFCEALLHQFPLEANVAGHFTVLEDRAASALLAEARRTLLTATSTEDNSELANAFATVMSIGDDTGLERLLSEIVAQHSELLRFNRRYDSNQEVAGLLRSVLEIDQTTTAERIYTSFYPLSGFTDIQLSAYIELANDKGGAKPKEVASLLMEIPRTSEPARRAEVLSQAFLTQKNEAKAISGIASKAMLEADPTLADRIPRAQEHILDCLNQLKTFQLYEASMAALVLARRLNDEYEELKKRRGHLDFDDLIARTAELLTKNEAGPWIHYKLDQGIDHVLVDEAQDTSPLQWQVVRSLTDEFFAGETARGRHRTLFAVGDEKQSIYSFQGARPERFSEEGRQVQSLAARAELQFSGIRLPLSFRSTGEVLSAVDRVFENPANAKGLTASGNGVIHQSSRTGHPGIVDVWEVVAPTPANDRKDWTEPFDATPESAPPARLARRIAGAIASLIGKESIIEGGKRRTVRAGDILVLVRKRGAFTGALIRALKARGDIPVAGADRLVLTDHIAIQDLIAVGRFALLQQDDLSLAALMKSPLLGLSEDDIMFASAYRKKGQSLWRRINELADAGDTKYRMMVEQLDRWIERASGLNPFEFYTAVLTEDGGRRKFLARLGTEAVDVLDEFLSLALSHEASGLPGLQSFISLLELEPPSIKREQDKNRNEVRIMTVHASKGLEAPMVFVVDDGGSAYNASHTAKLRFMKTNDSAPAIPLWVAASNMNTALVAEDSAALKESAEEEYRRLLYVAMTRAADRLIICGFRKIRENPESWHNIVWNALEGDDQRCEAATFSNEEESWGGLSWRNRSPANQLPIADEKTPTSTDYVLPDSLLRPLPRSKNLPRPLSPSGAGAIIDDDAPLASGSKLFGHIQPGNDFALKTGHAVHRLFQILPAVPNIERQAAAERYIEGTLSAASPAHRQQVIDQVFRVLDDPDFAMLFNEQAQAEVNVMGILSFSGEEFAVSGRIDRLAVDDERVIIADFKTNRAAPEREDEIFSEHRAQMAIYREILKPVYPGRRIECCLIYTTNGRAFNLDETELEAILDRLAESK